MRELVITNLTLTVDARFNDPIAEAQRVIRLANEALEDNDGGPSLYIADLDNIQAVYRQNGEDDEDDERATL